MKLSCLFSFTILLYCMAIVFCAEKEAPAVSPSSNSASSGTRQAASTALSASGILSTLTSFLPSSLTSLFPALLLFGLGAMLVPAFGLGMLLREGRRSDYNVQPSNLAFTNPLFTKNLPPIVYNEKFEGINRAYVKAQPQFQTARSLQSQFDFNPLVDILTSIQKTLDSNLKASTDNNKKNSAATSRLSPTEKR